MTPAMDFALWDGAACELCGGSAPCAAGCVRCVGGHEIPACNICLGGVEDGELRAICRECWAAERERARAARLPAAVVATSLDLIDEMHRSER